MQTKTPWVAYRGPEALSDLGITLVEGVDEELAEYVWWASIVGALHESAPLPHLGNLRTSHRRLQSATQARDNLVLAQGRAVSSVFRSLDVREQTLYDNVGLPIAHGVPWHVHHIIGLRQVRLEALRSISYEYYLDERSRRLAQNPYPDGLSEAYLMLRKLRRAYLDSQQNLPPQQPPHVVGEVSSTPS